MTITVALKVGDGIVLGADSASSLSDETAVYNVYFSADKIVNLYKGLPIGLATYGLGSLDTRSISSLAKDLRKQLASADDKWRLDINGYSMEWVCDRVKQFFYDERYTREYPKQGKDKQGNPVDVHAPMGFIVAGYSANHVKSEVWFIEIGQDGVCQTKRHFGEDQFGVEAKGQPEPLYRLVNGWSPRILEALVNEGIPQATAEAFLKSQPMEPLLDAAMPIQDAIDLVKYLIQVTEGFVRFIPGAPTVHEPIDIAAITYHEGFRWVQRKHYYSAELNPPVSK